MKQIGLGFAQYIQDNDEEYPSAQTPGWAGGWADVWCDPIGATAAGAPYTWDVQIAPYLKSEALLACPDDPTTPLNTLPGLGNNVRRSYAIPTHLVDYNFTNLGVKIAQIPSPTITIALCERRYGGSSTDYTQWGNSMDIQYLDVVGFSNPLVVGNWPHVSHTGANFLYADGHVKAVVHSANDNHYSSLSFPGYYYGPNNSPEFGTGRPLPQ